MYLFIIVFSIIECSNCFARDNQKMNRRLWIDVIKCYTLERKRVYSINYITYNYLIISLINRNFTITNLIILINEGTRYFSFQYFTKYSIATRLSSLCLVYFRHLLRHPQHVVDLCSRRSYNSL